MNEPDQLPGDESTIDEYSKRDWGRTFVKLSDENIEHLKDGGVLASFDGEYTTYIITDDAPDDIGH